MSRAVVTAGTRCYPAMLSMGRRGAVMELLQGEVAEVRSCGGRGAWRGGGVADIVPEISTNFRCLTTPGEE